MQTPDWIPSFGIHECGSQRSSIAIPERCTMLVVGVLAVLGWLLRVWPFLSFGNLWHVPVDYDDGVYFSAAALLAQGILPYRDFTFVHPPGIALFYLPVTLLADPRSEERRVG